MTGKKIIISTGMSSENEIDGAVRVLKDNQLKGQEMAILHCNSAYPAPIEDLNLSCIKTLKEKYGCEVGYSGHEFRLGTSDAAIYLGATDHMASVEPQGLFKLVRGIRELEKAYGDGHVSVTETEKKIRQKLRKSK